MLLASGLRFQPAPFYYHAEVAARFGSRDDAFRSFMLDFYYYLPFTYFILLMSMISAPVAESSFIAFATATFIAHSIYEEFR